MPLTDIQIRKAKPTEKPYKLRDGAGLHLYVTPAGGKHWRYRYEITTGEGKRVERLLTIGPYPDVSLVDAREARTQAKAALRQGKDPGALKRHQRVMAVADAAATFEVLARDWHAKQKPAWTDTHQNDVIRSLERDVFPDLGEVPIRDITVPMVLTNLRKVEKRGSIETARRIRQRMSAVFGYAIASGVAEADPAAQVVRAMAPLKKGRQPAITDLQEVREVLRRGEGVPAHPVTKLALRILALTALRPGELRGAGWGELQGLDGPAPLWVVPPQRMKMKVEHAVPLSRQAVEAFKTLKQLTGQGPLMFPSIRNAHRPISENAIGYLLNRAGYHSRHVPHGWRAAFSTIMNERFKADRGVIDLMLAHAPKDKVEGAYNRALHIGRRTELAQLWADLLMVEQASIDQILEALRR